METLAEKEPLEDSFRVKLSALSDANLTRRLQELKKSEKAEYLIIHKNPSIVSQDNEMLLPVKVELKDGKHLVVFVPFEDYFKLATEVWDLPDYGKDAELVTMERKMLDAAPYNVFFNSMKHCPETKDQLYSISFTDLLCPSFGKLKCSLHTTDLAQITWILANFALRKRHKFPMTILHGLEWFPWPEDKTMKTLYPDIDHYHIKLKEGSLGCHEPKLTVFMYDDDSMRVMIGTASLCDEDWSIYNNQLWISPRCPKLPEGCSETDGESATGFKSALLGYLQVYEKNNIPSLGLWIDRIKNTDFREIKVALLYSTPGAHLPRRNGCFVHFLGHILSKDCTIPAPKEDHDLWGVVAQTCCLGLVGRTPDEWLTTNVLKSLASHKGSPYFPTFAVCSKVKFSLIFPSIKNVRNGYSGMNSGACIRHDARVKELQPWLQQYMCQWKADSTKRTRTISRCKCYCRISPCWRKMAYFFLTSANLSRSGWGAKPNPDATIFNRSYHMGVLFLPKYFGEEYFEVMETPDRKNKRLFPLMFDLPLTPYGPNDEPYCTDETSDGIRLIKLDDTKTDRWVEIGKRIPVGSKPLDMQASGRDFVQKKDMKYRGKLSSDSFVPNFMKN